MPNFKGPYWVQINYHSASAPHTAEIPTKTWSPDGGVGTFETWAGGAVAADTMIEGLVTLMLPFFNSDVHFDNWIIFKQLLETDRPQPVMNGAFTGMVGTNTGASWAAAVEIIFIARTAAFGLARLTLLDACSENDFNPVTVATTAYVNLFNEWSDSAKGWSGRDNAQPSLFLKATKNLNQKLRKEYRLT